MREIFKLSKKLYSNQVKQQAIEKMSKYTIFMLLYLLSTSLIFVVLFRSSLPVGRRWMTLHNIRTFRIQSSEKKVIINTTIARSCLFYHQENYVWIPKIHRSYGVGNKTWKRLTQFEKELFLNFQVWGPKETLDASSSISVQIRLWKPPLKLQGFRSQNIKS